MQRPALLAVCALAACQVGEPGPVAWAGAAPTAIAVWPAVMVDGSWSRADGSTFGLQALAPALAARGYRTTSAAVAGELLAQHQLGPEAG
ncbi:MAG: hypothetical protein WBO45_06080, partial [Planctomycetota bacterium]